jgi:hypothetical protein
MMSLIGLAGQVCALAVVIAANAMLARASLSVFFIGLIGYLMQKNQVASS